MENEKPKSFEEASYNLKQALLACGNQVMLEKFLELEKAREELLRSKAKRILDRSSIFYNPEQFAPTVQDANRLISQKTSSIFD